MGRYSGLSKLKVSDAATREFRLDGVDLGAGTPKLIVRHAGESNSGYWTAILKQSNERQQRARKLTQQQIDDNRADDCKLLAKHVVVNWANVLEDDARNPGKPKPSDFSPETCEEFLVELATNAPDIFGALRAFVGDPDNFRSAPAVDGVELGKP